MTSCFRKCGSIPQRWVAAGMGFFAFFNAYTLRHTLSMAITMMAKPLNKTETDEPGFEYCPEYQHRMFVKWNFGWNFVGGSYDWDEYTQGVILSSFYWGYVITHIPGGLLVCRFGAKIIVGPALLLTSILTLATPTATAWGGAAALIAVRFSMGFCQGVVQPGVSRILSQWVPASERSTAGAVAYSGTKFGMLAASIVSGLIMGRSSSNWPHVFHLFGLIGVLWYGLWLLLYYDSPRRHPFISAEERRYLSEQLDGITHEESAGFPWRHALTSKPFLALLLMQCGLDWCIYTIMSDLPKYMYSVLRLPIRLVGVASSFHYITSWMFSIVVSGLSDHLIAKSYASKTTVRKVNSAITGLGPAIFLLLAVYAGCEVALALTLITLGLTTIGAAVPGIKVNVLDLSPNYAGVLMGIANGTGAFAGILAPYTIGVLTPNQSLSEWRLVFWILAGVFIFAVVVFAIFASGEVQPWNDPAFVNRRTAGNTRATAGR